MSKSNHLIIFGGGSDIALETSLLLLEKGWYITLINRSNINCEIIDKFVSHKNLRIITGIDFGKSDCSFKNIQDILSFNIYTHVLIAQGFLIAPNYHNYSEIITAYNCNVISVALILNQIYLNNNTLIKSLTVIGSIAGDRGKEKNPIYDSTKGGLEILCQGFSQRFKRKGIFLTLIKPGNINTKMHKINNDNKIHYASAESVAKDIINSFVFYKHVIYSPWYWRFIMIIIRFIPENLFYKLGIGKMN